MKYPKLVIEEAKALRKHATEEEIDRLNFDSFDPDDDRRCVYGQMTGFCMSERATDLIKKSCKRVYNRTTIPTYTQESDLNGSPASKHRLDFWSPIEVFIATKGNPDQKNLNENLIQFIKGEIDSL